MRAHLSFKAWRGNRYISLAEILVLIGFAVFDLKWALNLVEVAIGPDADSLGLVNGSKGVETLQLLHVVTPDVQIVDGSVEGYDSAGSLRVKVTAIDSSFWDVESEDGRVIDVLRERFKNLTT